MGHVQAEHTVSFLTTLQGPGIPVQTLKAHFQDLLGTFSPGSSLTRGQGVLLCLEVVMETGDCAQGGGGLHTVCLRPLLM